jgi:predicted metal-dependent phosphoesterase TrpH
MLIDLHTHTHPLSDDSELSPDELIINAKRAGLDGVCLTEHDAFWNESDLEALRRKHDFLVLAGAELNTEEEHLIVFGLSKWLIGMSRADFVIEQVAKAGGVAIVAHPFRRKIFRGSDEPGNERFNRELDRACANPLFSKVAAIEVRNAHADERENAFSQALADRLKLSGFGGSDAHEAADIGHAATYFEREIKCLDDLIAEIKAGRFRALTSKEIDQKLKPSKEKRKGSKFTEVVERMKKSGLYAEFRD